MVAKERVRRPGRTRRSTSAIAPAVVGVVAAWRDDPVVPAERPETDEETLLAAGRRRRTAIERRPPTQPSRVDRVGVNDDERSMPLFFLPVVRPTVAGLLVRHGVRLVVSRSARPSTPPPPPFPLLLSAVLLVGGNWVTVTVAGAGCEQDGLDARSASGTVDQQLEFTRRGITRRTDGRRRRRRHGEPFSDTFGDVDFHPAAVLDRHSLRR